FSPVQINGYIVGGVVNFALILEPSGSTPRITRYDLTPNACQAAYDDLARQGYAVKMVSGYRLGAADYYAAVWEKTTAARRGNHNLPVAPHLKAYDENVAQGFRMISLHVFDGVRGATFSSVWEK